MRILGIDTSMRCTGYGLIEICLRFFIPEIDTGSPVIKDHKITRSEELIRQKGVQPVKLSSFVGF